MLNPGGVLRPFRSPEQHCDDHFLHYFRPTPAFGHRSRKR